ncbi:MAG TPA: DNA topoisomerase III [Epulopiscium sp.]|nr:DNA topoisomerase III [Candidatus Epulonipiscium sp.]
MGKKLIVTEKPSVARDIARVLGAKSKGDGCLMSSEYVVTWAIGHLVTLLEPDEYDPKYKKWSLETLPILPAEMKIKPIPRTKSQFQIIKKFMKDEDVESIICATDSGREGELIFRYIYEHVKCKKPVERLWISSMTDEAIKKGFQSLKSSTHYDTLYHSAKCRSEADWLVGMNATRAFTLQYGTLLSVGRVQTPTLGIIVNRQKEINEFVPDEYFEVMANLTDFEAKWIDLDKDDTETNQTKIDEKEKANEIAEKIKGKSGIITDIETKQQREAPPLLYDLTELQRDGNKYYGLSAQKTLTIAQSLYEKRKAITYPRTDSRYVSEDMVSTLNKTLKVYARGEYEKLIRPILEKPKLPITKRIVNGAKVTDHHAIIPTDRFTDVKKLGADEQKIFNLILKRFIAVFYPPYIYTQTKVIVTVEEESLMAKGKVIDSLGWMQFYTSNTASKGKGKDKEEQTLPSVKKGDPVNVIDTEVLSKSTRPPRPYTEGTLLSAMENAGRFVEDEELKEQMKDGGLGTPATRASIIERLIQVGYIGRKGKQLVPTEKGMNLIAVLPPEIQSPEMTGKWEKGLSSIAKGTMDPERFMGSIERYVIYLIGAAKDTPKNIRFEQDTPKYKGKGSKPSFGSCPVCNKGTVLENSKAFYCSHWRQDCKFTLWKNELEKYGIKEITKEMIKQLQKDGGISKAPITQPQTNERAVADIVWKKDGKPFVELKNVSRPGGSSK